MESNVAHNIGSTVRSQESFYENMMICPKCKMKFHAGNFPGHLKYEESLSGSNIQNDKVALNDAHIEVRSSIIIEGKQILIEKNKENSEKLRELTKHMALDEITSNIILNLSKKVDKETDSIKVKCGSCYKILALNEDMITLPQCFHHFHTDHLAEWIKFNKICPVCKNEIKGAVDYV